MTEQQYYDYFLDVATRHPDLQHTDQKPRFFQMNVEEVISGRGNFRPEDYVLVIDSFEGQLVDYRSDNILDYQHGAFQVLRHSPKDDALLRRQIESKTKQIVFQILAKLLHDRLPENGRLFNLEVSNTKYFKIGPVFDQVYGHRCELTFYESASHNLDYDPSLWYPLE
ncbi:hypothetical protein SAMN05421823_102518 [Catalinimonas alkaloidigena]|uniref:Uncharacterized protein n=1 Tax=Catalinimonas alkaloidigena TaxID=1075417 RepID=A0A1G9B6M7_9BACT|nr:hypothetical protein [Catalinimonas alkaloidigena]SDK34744.1 hypothetical protein SAMN05421823_102518 [Catalinimonas alkaloidigena]